MPQFADTWQQFLEETRARGLHTTLNLLAQCTPAPDGSATLWIPADIAEEAETFLRRAWRGPRPTLTRITTPAGTPPPRPPSQPPLPGFPDIRQNWTQTPDFFFDTIVPNATPAAVALVAVIIRNTIGIRDKKGNWSEWWQASHNTLHQRTGISSPTTLQNAITEARHNGWIKRKPVGSQQFQYALRWHDEPVDKPP